eukprot:1156435-Pelagomonas_calceolata.AAC.4
MKIGATKAWRRGQAHTSFVDIEEMRCRQWEKPVGYLNPMVLSAAPSSTAQQKDVLEVLDFREVKSSEKVRDMAIVRGIARVKDMEKVNSSTDQEGSTTRQENTAHLVRSWAANNLPARSVRGLQWQLVYGQGLCYVRDQGDHDLAENKAKQGLQCGIFGDKKGATCLSPCEPRRQEWCKTLSTAMGLRHEWCKMFTTVEFLETRTVQHVSHCNLCRNNMLGSMYSHKSASGYSSAL